MYCRQLLRGISTHMTVFTVMKIQY
jgi:hypothetical protein